MNERSYDKLLHIKTAGKQESSNSSHYFRYEPTPYEALERLFDKYEIRSSDRLIDFGCGTGRLNFFVHSLFHASVVGVEMNEVFYQTAEENLKNYAKRHRVRQGQIQFCHCLAEEYRVNRIDNCFYFFNPFSVQIFMKVIGNILQSFEKTPREIDVILYYPSEDYIYFLEEDTPFQLELEVTLEELYGNNPYERFLVYRIQV